MKKVFIVRLSEDGISNEVYSNVKALHNAITRTDSSYIPIVIGYGCKGDPVYSYNNLCKQLKENKWSLTISCEGRSSIEIVTATIVSH